MSGNDRRMRELLHDVDDARALVDRIKMAFWAYVYTVVGTITLAIVGYTFIPSFDDWQWIPIALFSIEMTALFFGAIGLGINSMDGDFHPWADLRKAERKYQDYLMDQNPSN